MISISESFTPLPKRFWLEALHFDVRTNQIAVIATDHQSEDEVERRLHNKYRGNFQYTQTKNHDFLEAGKTTNPTDFHTSTGTLSRSSKCWNAVFFLKKQWKARKGTKKYFHITSGDNRREKWKRKKSHRWNPQKQKVCFFLKKNAYHLTRNSHIRKSFRSKQ